MHLLLNLIQLCFIGNIIKSTNGYVLLAANLDDFKSVAKKFVPERLSDQLTKMASYIKYRQEFNNKNQYSSNNDYSVPISDTDVSATKEEEKNKPLAMKKQTHKPTANEPDINIDDLVEKVKERLEMDFNKAIENNAKLKNHENHDSVEGFDNTKQKMHNNNRKVKNINKKTQNNEKRPRNKTTDNGKTESKNIEYDDSKSESKVDYADAFRGMEEAVTYKAKYQITKTTREPNHHKPKDTVYDEDEVNDKAYDLKTNPENLFFEGMDLAKPRDSYDDYVTPKKEDAFESEEATKTPDKRKEIASKAKYINQNINNTFKAVSASLSSEKENKKEDYEYTDDVEEEEVEARTESLWFDDSTVNAKDGAFQDSSSKFKSGTIIPTRQFYKMSSPNYYAKLPVVAQQYNFNEPLPEKDREPEKIIPVADPSANINGKFRLY